MVSILKRRVATGFAAALVAAGTIAGPTAAEAAPAAPSGTANLAPDSTTILPTQVVINRNVTFRGGVPVGGWYSLSVFPSGSYNYSGHMHDSGAPSYNFAGVCVVRFGNGTTFVFQTAGRMHGTFESGSRDHNWNRSGTRQSIRDAFRDSNGAWNARCSNKVNADLGALVNSTVQAVGYAAKVIAIFA
ncbi:hypothetical protein [Streptomyces sp. NK15101]|uniref:hypothetical protein n=1 Tax=Streptomyces sp. NK15101 TaxID=2873261 RepID=UPI001CEC06D2|nr:hypothetical protein [Streptomyces sp. NK15101]